MIFTGFTRLKETINALNQALQLKKLKTVL